MLEELAADVTGWGARVVPFFEELEWAQHLDHLRRRPGDRAGSASIGSGTVNIGNVDALDRLGGPFDDIVRSVDIRPFGAGRGRHNIKKIGFFLWRLRSNPLVGVEPVRPRPAIPTATTSARSATRPDLHQRPTPYAAHGPHGDRPSGPDQAAGPAPRPGGRGRGGPGGGRGIGGERANCRRAGCSGGGSRRGLALLRTRTPSAAWSSPSAGRSAILADQAIPASRVTVCNLSTWRLPPAGKDVAIDPLLGRMTLAPSAEPGGGETVRIGYCYGFSGGPGADLGGGPYDREPPTAGRSAGTVDTAFRRVVARVDPGTGRGRRRSAARSATGSWCRRCPSGRSSRSSTAGRTTRAASTSRCRATRLSRSAPPTASGPSST